MTEMAPSVPVNASPESPPVAAAEAQTSAPLLVSGIEAVARSRLLSVAADAPLVEVAALLSSAQISVVVVCKLLGVVNARDGLRALLAAGNHEETLLRNYVMGIGYQ